MADLLRPVHPAGLAQAEKVPRIFIRREPQVVEPEQHHARGPIRPIKRLLPRESKIRHPLVQPRTKIRPPQVFSRVLPVQRRNAALRFQHLARAAVHFPAHVKCKFWLYRHNTTPSLMLIAPPPRRRRDSARYRFQRTFPPPAPQTHTHWLPANRAPPLILPDRSEVFSPQNLAHLPTP